MCAWQRRPRRIWSHASQPPSRQAGRRLARRVTRRQCTQKKTTASPLSHTIWPTNQKSRPAKRTVSASFWGGVFWVKKMADVCQDGNGDMSSSGHWSVTKTNKECLNSGTWSGSNFTTKNGLTLVCQQNSEFWTRPLWAWHNGQKENHFLEKRAPSFHSQYRHTQAHVPHVGNANTSTNYWKNSCKAVLFDVLAKSWLWTTYGPTVDPSCSLHWDRHKVNKFHPLGALAIRIQSRNWTKKVLQATSKPTFLVILAKLNPSHFGYLGWKSVAM